MNEITQLYQAINSLSQRLNDINKKLDNLINIVHNQSTSSIDYLSMMTDIDIPSEEEVE